MKPAVHILMSLIIALMFFPAFKFKVLFILAGGVLIDIDHYLWYIFKFRKFGFAEAYHYFADTIRKERIMENHGILLIFHTWEFIAASILLSFYFDSALLFTIGFLAHFALDMAYVYNVAGHPIANHSLINWIYTAKFKRFKYNQKKF